MTALALAALIAAAAADSADPAPAPAEPSAPAAAPEPEPSLAFRGHLEWISAGLGTSHREAAFNPDNQILRLPQLAGSTELRPHLRLAYGPLEAVVRPRAFARATRARAGGRWLPEDSSTELEWVEAYGTWRVTDRLLVAYGLQSFQWGPAEVLSPSNRIFHETGVFRDPLYVVYGRDLVRVNVTLGDVTAVVLAEVGPNREPAFVAGQPFEPKAEIKVEWAGADGLYLGVTAGAGKRSHGFFGEYAAVPLLAGLSVYGDAVHGAGSQAWYPEPGAAGGQQLVRHPGPLDLRTLAVTGARYSFEGGTDLRVEYVYDRSGWTGDQLARAYQAALDPTQIAAYLDPGFELPGRHLAYASLSFIDLPPAKRSRVQLRYLRSLVDGSGVGFASATYDASDSIVVFLTAAATHGSEDGALSHLARAMGAVGAIVNW